jgi:hypothetical protein
MPNVFEEDGYRFFFYSNEHRPIHVRVDMERAKPYSETGHRAQ